MSNFIYLLQDPFPFLYVLLHVLNASYRTAANNPTHVSACQKDAKESFGPEAHKNTIDAKASELYQTPTYYITCSLKISEAFN